jgi:hypothetical protein
VFGRAASRASLCKCAHYRQKSLFQPFSSREAKKMGEAEYTKLILLAQASPFILLVHTQSLSLVGRMEKYKSVLRRTLEASSLFADGSSNDEVLYR